MAKNQNTHRKDKKALTLFLLLIPSLLLAMTSAIGETLIRIPFQVVLILLQYVLFKNLLDDYYGE